MKKGKTKPIERSKNKTSKNTINPQQEDDDSDEGVCICCLKVKNPSQRPLKTGNKKNPIPSSQVCPSALDLAALPAFLRLVFLVFPCFGILEV
jgi:hypothetical protein